MTIDLKEIVTSIVAPHAADGSPVEVIQQVIFEAVAQSSGLNLRMRCSGESTDGRATAATKAGSSGAEEPKGG